jgi:molybdopterin-containing oxidoreductase family membrane subunit
MASDATKGPAAGGHAAPIIGSAYTYGSITDKISLIVLTRDTPWSWLVGFGVGFVLLQVLLLGLAWTVAIGLGTWGINIPVGWGFAIINFVWWIGIGHAGTLISAILLLLRQHWRTSINRFAEAMTLFAVSCAGLFPLIHMGRPWFGYWMFPYPNTMGLWPQTRSPLVWDVFAVSTYATVSLLFWYVGLVPDLATLRDRAKHKLIKLGYGVLALGWRGSAQHWFRYEMAYLLLAGLATPLVLSVHSVVSFDFATSILPGWHTTIFPPYFVAGAIYSGFAMVMTLTIPLRKLYRLEDFITMRHLRNMANVMLATGLMVAYGYAMEVFFGWYSGNPYEIYMLLNRKGGPYAVFYWALILCNVLVPQLLWSERVKASVPALFGIAIVVNIGMWLERFIIVITSLHRDFLPSAWGMYYPTWVDFSLFFGSIGLFVALLFLFIRLLPMISIFEMRTLLPSPAQTRASRATAPAPAPATGD